MQRHTIAPRPHWPERVEKVGLTYHSVGGQPYWDESAYWEFTAAEVDRLEAATAELQRLCLEAGEFILREDRFAQMHIPPAAVPLIRQAWRDEPPALYGRMDLAFDGRTIKLLEYNADTPTALVEAAVAQWYWLEDRFPGADQFNSLHEKLVAKWRDLVPYVAGTVHFASVDSEEDSMTVTYLRDTAEQAGLKTVQLTMQDLGWDGAGNRFVDLEGRHIQTLFKLYPWEWLLHEEFAPQALESMRLATAVLTDAQRRDFAGTQWIEPIWKMLWSNKALLAVLWELFPNHELLLPAWLDGPRNLKDYVRKPIYGREGANVEIFENWIETERSDGEYGDEGFVYQKLAPLAASNGNTAIIGSWLIDGEPAGMGIRESLGRITTNTSRFVPHLFR